MADFTLLALKNEIVNDPESLGYKNANDTWTGGVEEPKDDLVIADLLNTKNLVVDRASVEMEQVRGITEFEWYDTLSIDEQEFMRWKTPGGGSWQVTAAMKLLLTGRSLAVNGVAGTGADNASFWSASQRGSAAPAMLALIEVVGSRAEVLWGVGHTISAGNVGGAANQ